MRTVTCKSAQLKFWAAVPASQREGGCCKTVLEGQRRDVFNASVTTQLNEEPLHGMWRANFALSCVVMSWTSAFCQKPVCIGRTR
eukprot:5879588-Pleurochrysis_carterae.AAC.4